MRRLDGAGTLPGAGAGGRAIVLLFGLLHDSKRLNEGHDPLHGRRAGAFAKELQGSFIRLSLPRLALLVKACDEHANGGTSDDTTIAACWDADRLNLWAVGAAARSVVPLHGAGEGEGSDHSGAAIGGADDELGCYLQGICRGFHNARGKIAEVTMLLAGSSPAHTDDDDDSHDHCEDAGDCALPHLRADLRSSPAIRNSASHRARSMIPKKVAPFANAQIISNRSSGRSAASARVSRSAFTRSTASLFQRRNQREIQVSPLEFLACKVHRLRLICIDADDDVRDQFIVAQLADVLANAVA